MSKSKSNRARTLGEMPVEELAVIRETMTDVSIKVVRRGPDGRFQSIIPNEMWAVQDILEGKLLEYVQAKAGGGKFVFEVRDPSDVAVTLAPRWEEAAMGPPRDPKMVPASAIAGQYATAPPHTMGPALAVPSAAYQTPGVKTPQFLQHGQVSLPPQDEIPAWAKSYAPEVQWKAYYEHLEQKGRLPMGASMHSDAVAQGHASTWQIQASAEKADNAKLRAELDAARTELARQARDTEVRLREIEKSSAEAQHRAELDALRAEIRATAQSRGTDWGAMLTGLAAIGGPVMQAMMESSSRRYEVEANRTIKHLELTSGQQNAMLAQMNNKPTTDWGKLMAVAVPVVVQYMQSNGMQARAEVEAMRSEQNLLQAKMVTDLLLELRGSQPEEPPWFPLAQAFIEALPGLGRGIAQMMQQRQMQQGAPRELPAQQQQGMASAPPSEDERQVWAHLAQMDADAAQQTQQIWAIIPADSGFRTHEWRNLIFNIHMRVMPEEMAEYLVDHLQHLARHHLLPNDLSTVFEQPELMVEILRVFPISKVDPEYTTKLGDCIIEQIRALGEEEDEEAAEPYRARVIVTEPERVAEPRPGVVVEITPAEAEDEEERLSGVGPEEQGALA
jgi:hypothetical protein